MFLESFSDNDCSVKGCIFLLEVSIWKRADCGAAGRQQTGPSGKTNVPLVCSENTRHTITPVLLPLTRSRMHHGFILLYWFTGHRDIFSNLVITCLLYLHPLVPIHKEWNLAWLLCCCRASISEINNWAFSFLPIWAITCVLLAFLWTLTGLAFLLWSLIWMKCFQSQSLSVDLQCVKIPGGRPILRCWKHHIWEQQSHQMQESLDTVHANVRSTVTEPSCLHALCIVLQPHGLLFVLSNRTT